jgi:hypothetical protein
MTHDTEQMNQFLAEALLLNLGDDGSASMELDQQCDTQTEKLRIVSQAESLDELDTIMMFDKH